jgi:hypothetical protein
MHLFEYKHMILGPKDCPVFHRWRIKFGSYGLALHRFVNDMPPELQHDHPWWFITFVLKGSYIDHSPYKDDLMTPGRIAFRSASHTHSVMQSKGCWTLVLSGPTVRKSLSYLNGRLIPWNQAELVEAAACNQD